MRNNFIKKTLKNGVTLYMYIDPTMRKTYVSYAINYGSSGKWFNFYYKDKLYHVLPGCAHFLEHMLGEHSKYGNIYKYFASKKYDRNGVTGLDNTRYFFCGTEDIKESIEKLINMVDDPVFTENDVEETKYAIIEETKRVLNNKGRVGYALCKRNLYKNLDIYHESLGSIGNEETTKSLDYNTLKLCYDAFYYDANKTLLVGGNFDEQEMVDYIESIYAKLKPHKKELKELEYKELDKVKKEEEIYYMPTNDDYVTIGFKEKIEKLTKKEILFYIWFILDYKFSDTKYFKKNLKKENIISYFSDISVDFYEDKYYEIIISVSAKDTPKFIEKIKDYMKVMDLTEKEFELYKRTSIADEAVKIDYKYRVLNTFLNKIEYSENFDEIDFIKTLTFDRFKEFFNSITTDNYTVSIIRNIDNK